MSAAVDQSGRRRARWMRLAAVCLLPLLAGGCNFVVMQPSGDVAVQQRNLVVASTALMLLVIVPVIVLTLLFAWRYRQSNKDAVYDPDWHHSTQLEVVIWTVPLVIIVALGAMTWISTHTLDPFRPLDRIGPERPVSPNTQPLDVEVVALDWKWMFFYPEQGIATINELAAPVDRPIRFKITSSTVMNAFYVPALAGMIYAMPGMQTQLNAVINKDGVYDGFSSNYSGSGFSRMTFKFHGLPRDGFDQWVAKAKAQGSALDDAKFLEIERPSENVAVTYFSSVQPGLFGRILNQCVIPGTMCMNEMMHIDAKGGGGIDSRQNEQKLRYDDRFLRRGDEAPAATTPDSGRPARSDEQPQGMQPRPNAPAKDAGDPHAGHSMPAPAGQTTAPAQNHH